MTLDDILNPKEAWLSNAHCRRSLMFDASAREKQKKALDRKRVASLVSKPIGEARTTPPSSRRHDAQLMRQQALQKSVK